MIRPVVLALTILLAGCHAARDTPGTVTADEDARLNDAAAALDANNTLANGNAP